MLCVIGNVGTLRGNLTLIPGASPDDGLLDLYYSVASGSRSCRCINDIDREIHAGCADPHPGTGNQLPGLGARATAEFVKLRFDNVRLSKRPRAGWITALRGSWT
jgi:hypothetical protein